MALPYTGKVWSLNDHLTNVEITTISQALQDITEQVTVSVSPSSGTVMSYFEVRRVGKVVTVMWHCTTSINHDTVRLLGTLPEGLRPARRVVVPILASGEQTGMIGYIEPTGEVRAANRFGSARGFHSASVTYTIS